MSGFKLLGIRPLEGCGDRFKKNLKEGEVYKFYGDYIFLDKRGNEISHAHENINDPIYNVKTPENDIDIYSNNDDLKIHISAIVGKNGSGKSTLIELFFLAVYLWDYKNIIQHKKDVEEESIEIDPKYSFNKILEKNKDFVDVHADGRIQRFFGGVKIFIKERVHLELYYKIDTTIYRFCIDTDRKDDTNWYQIERLVEGNFESYDYEERTPFYSIALNYSIHSLNTVDIGIWLDSIFHKNDAYQTPLVINPKREEGTIDIDNERGLQKARLLVNTMDIISNSPEDNDPLFNYKTIEKIVFKYRYTNYKTRFKGLSDLYLDIPLIGAPYDNVNERLKYEITQHQEIFKLKAYKSCSWIEKEVYGYLLYKTDRIVKNYPTIFNEGDYERNLKKIKDYDSHITYKLKQVIHFINHDNYIKTKCEEYQPELVKDAYGEGMDGYSFREDPGIEIAIRNEEDNLRDQIYSNQTKVSLDLINFLPPPVFEYDFHFSEKLNDTFENVSSGEKQQIYSIHTIMYHLRNVSSIKKSTALFKYNNINILLDEIELYFHPEMQRHFIDRLLKGIGQLSKYFKGSIKSINILIATHSPFILSDITSSNILRLNNGTVQTIKQQTFGANIHDLLANDFFLENGFMGEFAKVEIKRVVNSLQYIILTNEKLEKERFLKSSTIDLDKIKLRDQINDITSKLRGLLPLYEKNYDQDYFESVIKIVGEPMLYMSLMELYTDAFKTKKDTFLQSQIDRLINLKEK